jgi:hypothetical protein
LRDTESEEIRRDGKCPAPFFSCLASLMISTRLGRQHLF